MPGRHRLGRRVVGWCGAAVVVVAGMAAAAPDAAGGGTGAPDGEAEARALVRQLGDPDYKVREEASKRLREMGRDALPALTEALAAGAGDGADPEVCSRADAIMRRIQRPTIPSDWLGRNGLDDNGLGGAVDPFGRRGFGGTQVRMSVINGRRLVEVDAGKGRKVTIREGTDGIDMTVTGIEDGEPVTARFRARSAAELRDSDPDAYSIYQRWAGNGPTSGVMRGRRLIPGALGLPGIAPVPMPVPMPRPRIGREFRILPAPVAPPAVLRTPGDDLPDLGRRLRQQMQDADVPADQKQAVTDLLDQLGRIQAEGRAGAPADLDKQVQRYNKLSDALREKLEALKLPDPGDALPPPAKSRLGISVAAPAAELLLGPEAARAQSRGIPVTRVTPDSRGAKLGLKEGDVIRSVNGKDIADTAALRRAVTEADRPLVVVVERALEGEVTLREEPAAAGQPK